MKIFLNIVLIVIVVVLVLFSIRLYKESKKSQAMSPKKTLKEGALGKCPLGKKNCVSTTHSGDGSYHDLKSVAFKSSPITQILDILKNEYTVIESSTHYILATHTSSFWKFTDDIEFYYDELQGTLEMRSASRVGYSDINANRKRIKSILKQL